MLSHLDWRVLGDSRSAEPALEGDWEERMGDRPAALAAAPAPISLCPVVEAFLRMALASLGGAMSPLGMGGPGPPVSPLNPKADLAAAGLRICKRNSMSGLPTKLPIAAAWMRASHATLGHPQSPA